MISLPVEALLKTDELIAKHRPPKEAEGKPAAQESLWHLNRHGLMKDALLRQLALEQHRIVERRDPVVITKLAAWFVLAEAMRRHGLRLTRQRRGQ